jgi:hypothetical protein
MQTVRLKYDLISWITGLEDKKLILKLHKWIEEQESTDIIVDGIVPPRRIGSLTEGYGFWADEAPFDETNYRDKIWQTGTNVW